ncbi:unnamed protein product [Larinioides sclopetarius]|uniref:Uncharacterized protein n=1 Tax=Larinioides sclopetarius TaxID=280406 RepID=A0AAV1YY10_9ARAC
MRTQIIAIFLVAVFSCDATYLPGSFGLGGANYGGLGFGYSSSPVINAVSPSGSYASSALYNPAAAMKVAYVINSDLGNGIMDVGGSISGTPLRYGYGSSLGSYGNIAYVVNK